MRVETVWFVAGIRLPSGKTKTALSSENKWERVALEMSANAEQQLLYIEHRLPPQWVMTVPFAQIRFMHLDTSRGAVAGGEKMPVSKPRQRVMRNNPDAA